MKLTISASMSLDGDDAGAFVTRFDVRAIERDPRTGVEEEYGETRVAVVHVGEIADAHGDLRRALADAKLDALHDVYFEAGWYRDDYADGAGIDLLFIEHVRVSPERRAKNLDLAMVRRVCDTLGSGAQLAVLGYGDAREVTRWAPLGFAPSTPGRARGLLHMKLGFRTARVVDTGAGQFEVEPTFAPPPRAALS